MPVIDEASRDAKAVNYMSEQIELPEETLLPRGVGPQLRHAREKLGLSIKDVAEQTRISTRHIEHIEAGEFGELPGRTYAFGFARSIAKVVELDENDVAAMVRAELNTVAPSHNDRRQTYEPGDPARAPSGRLIWFSLAAIVLLLAGIYTAYRVAVSPAAEMPSLIEQQEQAEQEAAAAAAGQAEEMAPDPSGDVTFTASDDGVWVRFYDAEGRRLMETEMAQGDSYTVPADADGPQLWTGRPEALTITVGGRAVPPLSDEMRTMRDVPVDAASLLGRQDDDTTSDGDAAE